jgi:hypothetical protein
MPHKSQPLLSYLQELTFRFVDRGGLSFPKCGTKTWIFEPFCVCVDIRVCPSFDQMRYVDSW